jgi:hypothetical protein
MAVSDAQRRADEKYKREKTNVAVVRFYPAESELYEWLRRHPNKQGYIKALLREDMERHNGELPR